MPSSLESYRAAFGSTVGPSAGTDTTTTPPAPPAPTAHRNDDAKMIFGAGAMMGAFVGWIVGSLAP